MIQFLLGLSVILGTIACIKEIQKPKPVDTCTMEYNGEYSVKVCKFQTVTCYYTYNSTANSCERNR